MPLRMASPISLGAIDAHPFDATGTRHRREIRIVALAGVGIVEVGRKLASAEIAALSRGSRRRRNRSRRPRPLADRIPLRCQHFACMKKAPSPQTETQGRSGAATRAEHARDAKAHRTKPIEPISNRPLRPAEAEQPVAMHADIADEDRVLGQRLVDLERRALRIDRRGIVGEAGRDELVPFLAVDIDLREPFLARVRLGAGFPRRSSSAWTCRRKVRTSAISPSATGWLRPISSGSISTWINFVGGMVKE